MAPGESIVLAGAVLAACMSVFAAVGAYRAPFPRPIGAAIPTACLGLAPAMAGPFRAGNGPAADALAPVLWLASLIMIAAGIGRVLLSALFFQRAAGRFATRVAVLGAEADCAQAIARRLDEAGARVISGEADLAIAMACAGQLEEVVLGPAALRHVRTLACLPVALTLAVPVGGEVRLVTLCEAPLSDGQAVVKRLLDVVLAAVALLLFAPSMALIAVAVRLDSEGPVLFRQQRAGLAGRSFALIKFRTMRADAADPHGARQTEKDDARTTPVGRLLRRTSMDELPQLLNVLRGEMSLVGPRPHAWGSRAGCLTFEEVIGAYPARHRVRPGLTGLAQVRGHRGAIADGEAVRARTVSDLEYIRTWSLSRDLLILLRTAWVVLTMRNAA